MTRSLSQLKEASRNALAGCYMQFFLVLVITSAITWLLDEILSSLLFPSGNAPFALRLILVFLVTVIVSVFSRMLRAGEYFLSLNIARYNRTSVSDLFLAFRYDTGRAFTLCAVLGLADTICALPLSFALSNMLLGLTDAFYGGASVSYMSLFVPFLGAAAATVVMEFLFVFPLSQSLFLYIDHQEMSATDCLRRSISLMRGQKLNYLKLHLSFIGYYALCVLSLGVGVIWVTPYVFVTRSNFYMNLTGTYKPY